MKNKYKIFSTFVFLIFIYVAYSNFFINDLPENLEYNTINDTAVIPEKSFEDRISDTPPVLQDTIPLPDKFLGWWVEDKYINGILAKNTPVSISQRRGAVQFKENNKASVVDNFHEGWETNIKVINENEVDVLILYSEKADLSVKFIDDDTKTGHLFVNKRGVEAIYLKYPEKYKQSPPDELINEVFIAGTYNDISSPDIIVTFEIDGSVQGIENYDRYEVSYNFIAGPRTDWIRIYEEINYRNRISYKWEFAGDSLKLYDLDLEAWSDITKAVGPLQKVFIKTNK